MKVRGKLIKSDNALRAEEEGRYPISEGTRVLRDWLQEEGIKATLARCRAALEEYGDYGEWHHVSEFANEVPYYDVAEVFDMLSMENARKKLLEFLSRPSERKDKTERTVHVTVVWTEWHGSSKRARGEKRTWEGVATIKGDWIRFDNQRKKLSGNWIEVIEHEEKSRQKA